MVVPRNTLRSYKKERGYDRVQTYPQAEMTVCPATRTIHTYTFWIRMKYMNNRRSQITVYIIVGLSVNLKKSFDLQQISESGMD